MNVNEEIEQPRHEQPRRSIDTGAEQRRATDPGPVDLSGGTAAHGTRARGTTSADCATDATDAIERGTDTETATETAWETAQELATHGARVHPLHDVNQGHCSCGAGASCGAGGKHPRLKGWTSLASADANQLQEWAESWPNANWGLATGPTSGIVVIDADGELGDETQLALAPRDCVPESIWRAAGAIVQTGGGGYQLYFAPPKRIPLGNWVRCLPGVDVRSAGGQVVLPGSVSAKGAYRWVKRPTAWPLPPLPERYAKALARGHAQQRQHAQQAVALGQPVPKGQRDSTLYFTYIKGRWDAGVDRETILGDALEANRTQFRPPLEEWKVREKVQRVCAQPRRVHSDGERSGADGPDGPAATACAHASAGVRAPYREPTFTSSEERHSVVGDARRLAENSSDQLRYVPEWGWMGWSHGVWQKDIGTVRPAQLVEQTLRQARAWAVAPERNFSESQLDAWWKHIRAGFNRVPRIVDAARSQPELVASTSDFDTDPLLLNTPNGVVDLRRGEALPHDPSRLLTKQTSVPYLPEAACPRWLQFLQEIFPAATPEEQRRALDWVQRALGYSITGLTREQVWFFATGNGSNGKSVLMETVRCVLGNYAAPIRVEALLQGPAHRSGPDPELAATVGARFVTAQEPNEVHGRRATWDASRLKELTGGDTLQVHGKYERAYPYRPTFKLWVSANGQPELADTSYGTWRRIRVLPFVVRFDETGSHGHTADPTLTETLKAEGPGILAWLVQGAQAYLERGLGEVPPVIQEATREYHEQEDEYAPFFEGVLVHDRTSTLTLEQVWVAFLAWRQEGDAAWVTDKKALAKLAVSHGYGKKRGHGGNTVLTGCRLATAPTPSPSAGPTGSLENLGSRGSQGEEGEDKSTVSANSSQKTPSREEFTQNRDSASPSSPTTATRPTSARVDGVVAAGDTEYHLVTTYGELQRVVDEVLAQPDEPVTLDVETTGLDPAAHRLVSVQLGRVGAPTIVVDWRQATLGWDAHLQRLLHRVPLAGHNLAFDLSMLAQCAGVNLQQTRVAHDTMLAEQVILGGRRDGGYGLAAVAERYGCPALDKRHQCDFTDWAPGEPRWTSPFTAEQLDYMRRDVETLPPIVRAQQERLEGSGQHEVAQLEFAIVPVMAGLRAHGLGVDVAAWQAVVEHARQQQATAEAEARTLLDEPELNLNSPQQLLAALRAHGLEDLTKTNEATLTPLRNQFPVVDAVLRYREAAKVVSSYGASFLERLSPDGRLRGDWRQIGTETGRMACQQPALQTLPKAFRQAIVAAPGHVLLTADYSTMELRIAAALAGERRMLDAFAAGRDLHADTARYVFQLPDDADVRAPYRPGISYRDAGKRLNFSLVYGASAYGVAAQLDIGQEEAQRLLERFERLYPTLTRWSKDVRAQGVRAGFTTTALGRRRHYPVVDRDDWQAANRVRREAGNAPVQGCGADITKQAMKLFAERVAPNDGQLVIVLHDELVVECRAEVAEQVASELKRAMYDAGVWAEVPLPEPEVVVALYWTK